MKHSNFVITNKIEDFCINSKSELDSVLKKLPDSKFSENKLSIYSPDHTEKIALAKALNIRFTKKRFRLNLLVDLFLLISSFFVASLLKEGAFKNYIYTYYTPFITFSIVLLSISLCFQKYGNQEKSSYYKTIKRYIKSLFVAFSFGVICLFYFQLNEYSRFMVLGTVIILALLEVAWVSFYYAFIDSIWIREKEDFEATQETDIKNNYITLPFRIFEHELNFENIKKTIIDETNKLVFLFLNNNINLGTTKTTILSTSTQFNILKLPDNTFNTIVNLKKINNIKRINKFFEAINSKLTRDSVFVLCVETYSQRKKRILQKYPYGLNWLVYTVDFLLKRVAPKLKLTKKIYFFITGGRNRVLSKAETLGRLYSCGFEVLNEKQIDNLLWLVVKKVKEPIFDNNPTYGPFIMLKRFGKDGKLIHVYKMRTMHAYSEYIQDYVFKNNNLQEGGKFKDDFRITSIGKIMRKLWIDELPMFINVIKGDMKIVGVRPLSKHYFNLYSENLKTKRTQFKPGLIPPFYADMPKTFEEIMESEMKYLDAYKQSPLKTDWNYFWKALHNIIIKSARSA